MDTTTPEGRAKRLEQLDRAKADKYYKLWKKTNNPMYKILYQNITGQGDYIPQYDEDGQYHKGEVIA